MVHGRIEPDRLADDELDVAAEGSSGRRRLSMIDMRLIFSLTGTIGDPPSTAISPAPALNGCSGPPTVSLPSG